MKPAKIVLPLLVLGFLAATPLHGDTVINIVVKKQEEKKRYRWSLAEWFKVKSAMRMQDLWFAMNAPSPYEFYLGADYFFGRQPSGAIDECWRINLGGYARIFGLEFEKVFRNQEWSGIFNLRVFGRYVQSTNLTLQGGIRSFEAPTIFRNLFAGGFITLYITKELAVEGLYRHFFTSLENPGGLRTWGDRFEATVFLDYKVARAYVTYLAETEQIVQGSPATNNNISGFRGGLKLFF
ncbi:MAG: hypothetical protein KDD51_12330 [Bdellovibrionales bacterium]|nr:hypothetical protein [Bdellovibrionales bacterium]